MAWKRNLLNHPVGVWRSLGGAADEQGFIGKATGAGFHIFFKVWRDMPYDAVLDYRGALYRVEVKGTTTKILDLTRGGRSGSQISRSALSRKRPINQIDCDFVVGVKGVDNSCYILPVEIIEILSQGKATGSLTVPVLYLDNFFAEKWELFTGGRLNLSQSDIRQGFRTLPQPDRDALLTRLGLPLNASSTVFNYLIIGTKKRITSRAEVEALQIWEHLSG